MAPPPRPLPDDMIPEILLRVPPDDPASIARASAVCKAWRSILGDPAFLTRYRELHPTAPVLGFLHNPWWNHEAPRFVPTTTSSFRLPTPDCHSRHVWDCRHGRVLLYDYAMRSPTRGFVVWDPITGDQHRITRVPDIYSNGAVICTAAGCDNRDCSGGPFIVAFAGIECIDEGFAAADDDDEEEEEYGGYRDAHAGFYSPETGEWTENDNIHLDLDDPFDLEPDRPAALIGDSLYFVGRSGTLLQFWFGPLLRLGLVGAIFDAGIPTSEIVKLIEPPAKGPGEVIVMTAEGGGLGLAWLKPNSKIALWARETKAGPKGDADVWVKRRTIDLNKLIPLANPTRRTCLSGMIPGDAKVIFVSTEDGVFRIELEPSLHAKKGVRDGHRCQDYLSLRELLYRDIAANAS